MTWLQLFLRGLAMGVADIIPGVSGGTLAFVMGIYDDWIDAIKQFWRRLDYLLPICLGMAVSIGLLAGVIHLLLGHEVYRSWLYSLFFGLIIASIWFCCKQVRLWKLSFPFLMLVGAVTAFSLTLLQFESGQATYQVIVSGHEYSAVSSETLEAMQSKGLIDSDTPIHQAGYTYALGERVQVKPAVPIDWWIITCGAIAVMAMLLPGISGSYMLNVLGVYPLVIAAISGLVRGNLDGLALLANLLVGIVLGAVLFSRCISWLLHRYHDATVATLIGFMVGALPSIWPFWSVRYVSSPLTLKEQLQPVAPLIPPLDSPILLVGVLLAVVGFTLVVFLERKDFSKRVTKSNGIA